MRERETGPFLRRMRASDLRAVMEIDAISLPRPWSEGIWRSELESPFGLYLVLEEGEEVVGQIGVRSVLDELHVTNVAVHPEHRRRGHARAMIRGVLSAYPDARLVHLEVRPTNTTARTLYRSLGFRETGRRPRYYGDEDALLMTLDLSEDRP
ncbi:MAG: Ribosomal-protein-S18p-alanine acetyltransferase [uncultured Rubrobacteraceae bacterium]|uniref:[Ribosomal protein bS18]-alanine N-acetyltransferase n=1 Tax=uncultured Rubrobacteraceae bacterium TaxID=349277 RepID=A0A6J4PYQ7_9ACTN|nr:MAG: Ribosomal-protein-S18p-alanine acetyltransferase [uncultured Rubrobacteraceae bacterium]